jgi:hypothetical protein
MPFDFLEHDHLLVVDLADDDPLEFHLDRHARLTFGHRAGTKPDYRALRQKGSSTANYNRTTPNHPEVLSGWSSRYHMPDAPAKFRIRLINFIGTLPGTIRDACIDVADNSPKA